MFSSSALMEKPCDSFSTYLFGVIQKIYGLKRFLQKEKVAVNHTGLFDGSVTELSAHM